MRFLLPRTVILQLKTRGNCAAKPLAWELRLRGGDPGRPGAFLAEGTATTRADARQQAWHVCEQSGLVVDA